MIRDSAESLASRGLRVFPLHGVREEGGALVCTCREGARCPSSGKHPRVRDWKTEATLDPAKIHAWWDQWPDANIGVLTTGLVVMDVDPRNGGAESLMWLEGNEPDFPPTMTVRTGSGGWHFIYKQTEPVRPGKLLEGIDVKADDSYVVGAGSRHVSGGTYELESEGLTAAPAWLRPTKQTRESSPYDDDSPIPAGARNDFLVHVAAQLRNATLGEEAIFSALMQANLDRCNPPETEERVREIAEWAAKKDIANPYHTPVEGVVQLGDERIAYAFSIREVRDAAAATERKWLIRNLLLHPTYGMVGGEQKSLKSWVSLEMAFALASGEPCFNDEEFAVTSSCPVLYFYGEGGQHSFHDRVWHIARSRGMSEEEYLELPIWSVYETPPVTTDKFVETIITHVDRFRPGLVVIDPLYRYLDANTDMRSLVAVGQTLNRLQHLVYDRKASLLIPHHFNRVRDNGGLGRLSGAGGAEWADSWMLLAHRQDPELNRGRYYLEMQIGSRQWDGGHWDVDVALGSMNRDTLQWEGDLTWTVREHAAVDGQTLEQAVAAWLLVHPGAGLSELLEDLGDGAGYPRTELAKIFAKLADD